VRGDRSPPRTAVIGFGVFTAVALFPVAGASVIDGEQESYVKTVVGWVYRVPGDSRWEPVMVLGLPLIEGILAGFAAWAVVTLLRHPAEPQRDRAVAILAASIIAGAAIVTFFALQPSHYRHVF
jgi:hypothetical protein